MLTLRPTGSQEDRIEQEVLSACGVKLVRVVIPTCEAREQFDDQDESVEAKLAKVEEAARVVADTANQPVFLHCSRGKHRAGAVIAVFRMNYCGWAEEATRAEMARWGAFDGANDRLAWPDRLLREYCAQRDTGPSISD